MLKAIVIISFMLIYTLECFSQKEGYIALSTGPGMPVGEFAGQDYNNEKAGLAKLGAFFDLSYAAKLGKNFGFSVLLRGQSNAIDSKRIEAELLRLNPGFNFLVKSKNWGASNLMIGGYGSFPLNTENHSSFETRALIGIISATSPEIRINATYGNSSQNYINRSITATSYSLLVGAGFKFNLNSKICLITNLDILASEPKFNYKVITYSTVPGESFEFRQQMTTINLGVGVGFRL